MSAYRINRSVPLMLGLVLFTASVLPAQSYDNNRKGLEKLTQQLLQAAQKNQADAFQPLVIDDHAPWFESTFGSGPGASLSAMYEAQKSELAVKLCSLLAARPTKGKPEITVQDAAVKVDADLALMNVVVRPLSELHIYHVFLGDGNEATGFDVGYFVFLNGGFRYVGRLYVVKEGAGKRLIFPSADVAVTSPLLRRPLVRPRYPDAAKSGRIQGTVLLEAVVLENGDLDELQVVQGITILANAARDAVAQWKCRPLEVGGRKYKSVILVPIAFTFR